MIEWPSFRNIWKFSNTSGRARESGGRRGVASTESFWAGKTALVTGGASFIGATLTDHLIARGVLKVRIVDDLTSGHLRNIRHQPGTVKVDFLRADLREQGVWRAAIPGGYVAFLHCHDHRAR